MSTDYYIFCRGCNKYLDTEDRKISKFITKHFLLCSNEVFDVMTDEMKWDLEDNNKFYEIYQEDDFDGIYNN
jgi:hypothetical protein